MNYRFCSYLLALVLLGAEARAEIIATINGEAISMRDLIHYARQTTTLSGYLSVPGGPMQVLDIMLQERLLLLEGKRLGIEPNERAKKHTHFYVQQLHETLIKSCSEPDAATARAYYDAHPEQFSTPLFLRLRRIGLQSNTENRSLNAAKLEQIKRQLVNNEIDFATAEQRYNEDAESRERAGDIGYFAVRTPDAPFWRSLVKAKIDEIVGPLQEKEFVFLYQVTHRREPILEPYETAEKKAFQAQHSACNEAAADAVFAELTQRWPVDIKVDNISIFPE